MKIDIENERVNRLLHRTELKCTIETDGTTPSRKDLIKQIAAKKGVNENLVVVDNIEQEYGKKIASAYVKVYESEKAAQTIEPKYKVERGKKALEEKPKAEAPAEEKPAEEAPAEGEVAAEEKPVEEAKEGEQPPTEEKPTEEKKEEEAPAEQPVEESPEEKEAPAEEKKEGEE